MSLMSSVSPTASLVIVSDPTAESTGLEATSLGFSVLADDDTFSFDSPLSAFPVESPPSKSSNFFEVPATIVLGSV